MTMTRPTSEQITHNGQILKDVLGPVVSVTAYGAKGDGVTDDTAAIQDALDAGANNEVVFPAGTYLVYGLKVSGGTIVSLGTATIKKRPAVSGDQNVAQFTGNNVQFNAAGFAPVFYLTGDNIVIRGGTIDGNRANDTLNTSPTWAGSFSNMATRAGVLGSTNAVPSCRNVTIDGVHFKNMVGTAIDLDIADDIRVENCRETNAGHFFANITSDATTFTTNGRIWFCNNSCSGDRVFATTENSWVLDRKDEVVISGNVMDESMCVTGAGCKVQDSRNVSVTGNTFINTHLKPQCAPTFVGNCMSVTGNTFTTSDWATHVAGVANMNHPFQTLSICGNTVVNGVFHVEGSCRHIVISGNAISWTVDPGVRVATISANSICPGEGQVTIAGNVVDGGGFDESLFVDPNLSGGVTIISGNVISGFNTCWWFRANTPSAGTEHHIIGNTIRNCRQVGRINLNPGTRSCVIKGNSFLNVDTTAPVAWGTSRRSPLIQLAESAYTIDMISVEGNTWDSSWGTVASSAVQLFARNAPTVTSLVIARNIVAFAESINGMSFASTAGSMTFTNAYIYDNHCVGGIQMPSGATITGENVGNNSFTVFSTVQRKLENTTKKSVDINGALTTTVGSAGAASALPATPTGYVTAIIDGTARKIPYYAS